ncbi:hypothetical protein EON83_29930 [bacterium]|nr:MAG: hypothetical protein EON83_29930 [bacterium]
MSSTYYLAKRAFIFGIALGAVFFFVSIFSVMMVFGDGTAPALTHVMLELSNMPTMWFHLPSKWSILFGTAFWGISAGAVAFLFMLTVTKFRES